MSLQLLIELQGVVNPTVWRRVVVPESTTFDELHFLIQLVFGWENEHLYEFANHGPKSLSGFRQPVFIEPAEDTGSMFSMFGPTPGKKSVDSSKARVGEYFLNPGDFMIYTYDFGDNWEHKVTLESIDQNTLEAPDLIDGAGLCPPEDCGGAPRLGSSQEGHDPPHGRRHGHARMVLRLVPPSKTLFPRQVGREGRDEGAERMAS